ncbi:hypothetical protein [Litchfieldia alkalitelluris]|uniref:hypothetical protein n=1 Tax=Litchfieldia alkalitelluris TaxID=304268 RepID=UPI0009969146|nr:hypothetical protein [Litchfieldia alkalitelluris]
MNQNKVIGMMQLVGWAIIVVGIIAGLYIAFTLKTYTPGLTEGYMYEDPHPLRLLYALASILSSAFFGSVLIGLSEIISNTNETTTGISRLNYKIESK